MLQVTKNQHQWKVNKAVKLNSEREKEFQRMP